MTHSRADDRFAATIAAATLAEATAGLLFDEQGGRFVRWRKAVSWARRTARAPSPEDLARRERVREVVQEFVQRELGRFGYRPFDLGPSHSRPEESWLVRAGKTFPTELVEVAVIADAADSHLCVSFSGSELSPEELRRLGLEGNAAGLDLFQLHPSEAYRSADPPLPPSIPVTETFPDSAEAKRLMWELREADERIFEKLRESLSRG